MSIEGFALPFKREIIAEFTMPDFIQQRMGQPTQVSFRIVQTQELHTCVVEVCSMCDSMGEQIWTLLQFAADMTASTLLHCAVIRLKEAKSELSEANVSILSQKVYIEALENELSALRDSIGDPPRAPIKPPPKKRKPAKKK